MYINVQEAVKLIHINDQETVIHVRISDHIDVDIAYCFFDLPYFYNKQKCERQLLK